MESKVLLAGELNAFGKKKYERIFETVKTFHPCCFAFMKGSGDAQTHKHKRVSAAQSFQG